MDDPRKAVYREEAIKMLNEAIGSPKTDRKSGAADPPSSGKVQDSLLTSEGSSASLSTTDEESPFPKVRKSKYEVLETKRADPSGGILKHKVQSRERPRTAESRRKPDLDNVPPANGEIEQHIVRTSASESGLKKGGAETTGIDDAGQLNQRRSSEGALAANKPIAKVRSDIMSQQRPRSASARTGGVPSDQKRRPRRVLPVAKPVSGRPSSAALRIAQERQQPKKPDVQLEDVRPDVEPDGDTREAEPAEKLVQHGNSTEGDKADQNPVASETVTSTAEISTEGILERSVGTSPCATTLQVSELRCMYIGRSRVALMVNCMFLSPESLSMESAQ